MFKCLDYMLVSISLPYYVHESMIPTLNYHIFFNAQAIDIPPIRDDGLCIKDSVSVDDPFKKFMENQLLLDHGEHSYTGSQSSKKIHLSSPVSDNGTNRI